MRSNRPQPGPLDPRKTPAQPGGGAAHSDPTSGTVGTTSVPPHAPENHPSLIALARLLGHQLARKTTRDGGDHG